MGLLTSVILSVALAVLFHKAQRPFWVGLIPFYNIWMMSKLIEKPVWGWFANLFMAVGLLPVMLLSLGGVLPIFQDFSEILFFFMLHAFFIAFAYFCSLVLYALMGYGNYHLAKKFGFGILMALATAVLPFIFLPIIAWKGRYNDASPSSGLISGNAFADQGKDFR